MLRGHSTPSTSPKNVLGGALPDSLNISTIPAKSLPSSGSFWHIGSQDWLEEEVPRLKAAEAVSMPSQVVCRLKEVDTSLAARNTRVVRPSEQVLAPFEGQGGAPRLCLMDESWLCCKERAVSTASASPSEAKTVRGNCVFLWLSPFTYTLTVGFQLTQFPRVKEWPNGKVNRPST